MSSFDGYNSNGWREVSDSGGGVGGVRGWGVAIKQEETQQQQIIMPSPAYSRGLTRGASASIIPKSDLGTVIFRRKTTTLLYRNLIKIERDNIRMQQMEATIESQNINGERHKQQMQAAKHLGYHKELRNCEKRK